MAGEFSIASFNLHNFNYKSADATSSGVSALFKKAKLKRLAELFTSGDYDIIALQEIQTPETVKAIVNEMGNSYRSCHCHDFYDGISEGRFKSPGREKRGELAFIWNANRVELYKNCAVYQRLNDRMWLALDYFIQGASALLASYLGAGAILADEDEDLDDEEKRKSKKSNTAKKSVKCLGAAGAAAAGYLGHKYLGAQLKRMRPPFVAIFNRRSGSLIDKERQIRLLNVHSQFGRTDADKSSTLSEIRTKEAEYVLREAFQIVKSERDDESSLGLVMALGDFNLSEQTLQKIAGEINAMPMRSDKMEIGVAHLTTVSVSNQEEVKQGKPREYKYSNDYDHFAFDMDVWDVKKARRCFDKEYDKFYVLEGVEKRALSDHLPVVITTDRI